MKKKYLIIGLVCIIGLAAFAYKEGFNFKKLPTDIPTATVNPTSQVPAPATPPIPASVPAPPVTKAQPAPDAAIAAPAPPVESAVTPPPADPAVAPSPVVDPAAPVPPAPPVDPTVAPAPADPAVAAPVVPAPAPATAAKVYEFTTDTAIVFEGSKGVGTHTGGFTTYKGAITLAGATPDTASVEIEIDMNSTFSDDNILTTVLKDNYFHTKEYPTSTFKSTKVEVTPEGVINLTGDLTLNGVTQNITFPVNAKLSDDGKTITASSEFVINRKLWNVDWPGWVMSIVEDNVALGLEVVAKLKE